MNIFNLSLIVILYIIIIINSSCQSLSPVYIHFSRGSLRTFSLQSPRRRVFVYLDSKWRNRGSARRNKSRKVTDSGQVHSLPLTRKQTNQNISVPKCYFSNHFSSKARRHDIQQIMTFSKLYTKPWNWPCVVQLHPWLSIVLPSTLGGFKLKAKEESWKNASKTLKTHSIVLLWEKARRHLNVHVPKKFCWPAPQMGPKNRTT